MRLTDISRKSVRTHL